MRWAILAFVLWWIPMANAGSIFDDQDPTQAKPIPPRAAPQIPPAQPAPSPQPQPQQRPIPFPVRSVDPTPTIPSEPNTADIGTQAKQAMQQAKALAAEYFQKAQQDVQSQLAANKDYVSAKQEMDLAKSQLDSTKLVGTPEQKLQASSIYTQAQAEERRMRLRAYAQSTDYQEAKAMNDLLNSTPVIATDLAARKTTIVDAITRRELIEGMTIDEANRAARSRAKLMSSRDGEQIFRWDIKGQVGTHQELAESHPSINGVGSRDEYTTVADYDIVAYVEAVFIDGKLTSFQRFDHR